MPSSPKPEARSASANFGRLDDSEFELFARALCVAGFLPSEAGSLDDSSAKSRWISFKEAVDALIFPKTLKTLTRQNPTDLLIQLPGGGTHRVHELSSGERQALIILSRVFRGGEGHSLIAIDEPDAYLHPNLSARLLTSLNVGLADGARLIMATHSPAILDSLPPEAIFRLSHSAPAHLVATEDERVALYRTVGFRASALSQAEFLLVTEGDFDAGLLPQLLPGLGSAGIRAAGGRAQVFRSLEGLRQFELPIIGVVDSDVHADAVPEAIADICYEWTVSDMEAVLLSDTAVLQEAITGALVTGITTLDDLQAVFRDLLRTYREQAVAEYAQRRLRVRTNIAWPSPRGQQPLARLEQLVGNLPQLDASDVASAVVEAEAAWEAAGDLPWSLVRGKWVLPGFVKHHTGFKTTDAFIAAVIARQPSIAQVDRLQRLITAQLQPLGDEAAS